MNEILEQEEASLGFESLFAVLKTIAHQVGVEKTDFINKYDIVKSIFDKFTDGREVSETTIFEIAANILQLIKEDMIHPAVRPNKLTFDGSIWKFERVPDPLEYVTGDLYVNSNKVGTYNGFTCNNTLSGWEEAALAIESTSFGNQAVSLMKEEGGEWQIK